MSTQSIVDRLAGEVRNQGGTPRYVYVGPFSYGELRKELGGTCPGIYYGGRTSGEPDVPRLMTDHGELTVITDKNIPPYCIYVTEEILGLPRWREEQTAELLRRSMSEGLNMFKSGLVDKEVHRLRQENESLTGRLTGCKNALMQETERRQRLQAELSEAQKPVDSLRRSLEIKERAIDILNRENKALFNRTKELRGTLNYEVNHNSRLLGTAQSRILGLETEVGTAQRRLVEMETQLADARRRLRDAEQEVERLRGVPNEEVEALRAQVNYQFNLATGFRQSLETTKAQLDAANAAIASLGDGAKRAAMRFSHLEAGLEDVVNEASYLRRAADRASKGDLSD